MNQTTTYTSRDFYLSAFLVASGIELQAHRRIKEGLTIFIFQNSNKLEQHVKTYYALEARINPVAYGNSLKNLKAIIHQADPTNSESTLNRYEEETQQKYSIISNR